MIGPDRRWGRGSLESNGLGIVEREKDFTVASGAGKVFCFNVRKPQMAVFD